MKVEFVANQGFLSPFVHIANTCERHRVKVDKILVHEDNEVFKRVLLMSPGTSSLKPFIAFPAEFSVFHEEAEYVFVPTCGIEKYGMVVIYKDR